MDLSVRVEREFLPFVTKPARYLGNEYNTVRKKLSEIKLRIALCYPAIYEQGMTDLNFEILYYVLNSRPSVWAERFFAPSQDAVDVLKEKNIPLFSLESKTALNIFDIVIFTLRSESQYIDLLNILNLGGIPSRSKNRTATFPMIIGAGSFKWNPEPVADFFDIILTEYWHADLLPLIELTAKAKKDQWGKAEVLNRVGQLKWAYVPDHYKAEYNSFGEFGGLRKVGVSTSAVTEPANSRTSDSRQPCTVDLLFPLIRTGIGSEDLSEAASLIFGNVQNNNSSDFGIVLGNQIQKQNTAETAVLFLSEGIAGMIWKNVKEKIFLSNQELRFSFPAFEVDNSESLGFDFQSDIQRIGRDEEICISCGAGSPRLRAVIDKHYRDEDLYRLISFLIRLGFSKICLSFTVGLPTEKDEDITLLLSLIKRCAEITSGVADFQLSIQISPFVPQPFTMLQWEGMETCQKLQGRYEALRQGLESMGVLLRLEDIQRSMVTAILKRGGRSLADVIESAWLSGATSQFVESDFLAWDKALEQHQLTWGKLLEPVSTTVPLPWDHFDYGDTKYDLKNRRLKALQGKIISSIGDYVCLGSGMHREQFNSVIKNAGVTLTVENKQAPPKDVSEPSDTIQYGRKARRQISPKAPIKKRVRIQYAKTGLARFISHLDVGRVFEIAARKASISLVYTQGKSPHPRFSFGPPLPVGIGSMAEYIDLDVEIGDESNIQTCLNAYFPDGIKIVHHKILFAKVPALSAVINIADYHINLRGLDFPQQVIEDWMGSTEILIEHSVKEEVQELNIRPFVTEMQIDNNLLKVRTTTIEGKIIRINEVLGSLQISGGIDSCLVQRVGQFIQNDAGIFTPFDII